jgi:hypothetical protein
MRNGVTVFENGAGTPGTHCKARDSAVVLGKVGTFVADLGFRFNHNPWLAVAGPPGLDPLIAWLFI